MAKKPENTGSTFTLLHLGHLTRLLLRSLMLMVKENFFLHGLQRKS